MKLLKKIVAGAFLATALAQSASAFTSDLHIYITGSTAYRNAALPAIATALGISAGSLAPDGGTGSDYKTATTGKTTFIFEGGKIGSTNVTVMATFTGSESGVQTMSGSLAIPFMNDSDAASNPSVKYNGSNTATAEANPSAYTNIQGTAANSTYATHVPDIAFSDVYQGTTPFNNTFSGHSYTTANDNVVGIVTFKFMASTGFPLGSGSTTGTPGAGTTVSSYSMEPNFFQRLFSSGIAPLSQMTGLTAHNQVEIVATGRNPDSGTRATALADTGYGVSTPVQQYYPAGLSGTTVTDLELYPADTIAGIAVAAGNNGQATGSNLRAYLQDTIPASLGGNAPTTTAMYFVTYLGTSDAASVEGGATGAVELAYKGTNFSIAAIYQGVYSDWSYEHVLDIGLAANGATGAQITTKKTFETNLVSTIQGYTTGGVLNNIGISVSDPNILGTPAGTVASPGPGGTGVSRSGDGKPVTLGYTF